MGIHGDWIARLQKCCTKCGGAVFRIIIYTPWPIDLGSTLVSRLFERSRFARTASVVLDSEMFFSLRQIRNTSQWTFVNIRLKSSVFRSNYLPEIKNHTNAYPRHLSTSFQNFILRINVPARVIKRTRSFFLFFSYRKKLEHARVAIVSLLEIAVKEHSFRHYISFCVKWEQHRISRSSENTRVS